MCVSKFITRIRTQSDAVTITTKGGCFYKNTSTARESGSQKVTKSTNVGLKNLISYQKFNKIKDDKIIL